MPKPLKYKHLRDVPKRDRARMQALAEGAPRLACEGKPMHSFSGGPPEWRGIYCARCDLAWDADKLPNGHPQCGIYEPLTDADFALEKATRPRKKPQQREKEEVQRPLVVHLRRHLPAGSVVFAVPNLSRSREQSWALIRDGMLPGIPDIGIVTKTSFHSFFMIECKHPDGGTLSEAQKIVHAQLQAMGIPVLSECRSVAQAITWLEEYGVAFR